MKRETERRSTTAKTSRRRGSIQSETRPETGGDPDRVRILAYEIYETRQGDGTLGDPVSDWLEAERRLNEAGTDEPARAGTRRKRAGR